MIMNKFVDEIRKYHVGLFVMGILFIALGITANNVMLWADQTTLTHIERCIVDMHFRHNNETQFQECVSPDLKKIEAIQQINTYTTILFSIGGVFVGLGFRIKSKSKNLVIKQDICNCGTAFRCPIHDK
jgi:hypothetical protein